MTRSTFKRIARPSLAPGLGLLAVVLIMVAPGSSRPQPRPEDFLEPIVQNTTGTFQLKMKFINELKFSPDGKLFAFSSTEDTRVSLWDTATQKEVATVEAHEKGVYALRFSTDGKTLVTSGKDNKLRLWSVPHGKEKELELLAEYDIQVTDWITFGPDGNPLVVQTHFEKFQALDVKTGKVLSEVDGSRPYGWSGWHVELSRSGDFAYLAAEEDDAVHFMTWELATGKQSKKELPPPEKMKFDLFPPMAISSDGKFCAAGYGDDFSKFLRSIEVLKKNNLQIGFHEYMLRSIKASESAGYVRVWDVEKGEELFLAKGHCVPVKDSWFFPDGKVLASRDEVGVVKLWDINKRQAICQFRVTWYTQLAFSPDGETIAAVEPDGSADLHRLWR